MSLTFALEFMGLWFLASIPAALVWGRVMRHVSERCGDDE
jgi:hypothetical protein